VRVNELIPLIPQSTLDVRNVGGTMSATVE